MGSSPLVSIVIPCLNSEAMLPKTLGSCLAQTHRPLEVIVVDNGSSDRSKAIAAEFKASAPFSVELLDCREPGACAARNRGFERARGEYVQWLDSDDELSAAKIANQVSALEARSDCDVAYGDFIFAMHRGGGAGVDLHLRPSRQFDDMLLELLLDHWRVPCAYLVRRSRAEALHAIRAFNPTTKVLQDREYFMLAAVQGARFLYVPSSLVIYNKWSPKQTSAAHSALVRARSLSAILARCRDLAAQGPPERLSESHRWLLAQSCDLYRARPGLSVGLLESGEFSAEVGGTEQIVSVLDALVLETIQRASHPQTLEVHGASVEGRLGQAFALDVRYALGALAGRGLLERVS